MRLPGSFVRRALLGTALAASVGAGAAGCYVSYSSCDTYYGYYDYYCDDYWYDYWWYYDYDWYYYRTIPDETYPNPDPTIEPQQAQATTRVSEVVFLAPGAADERPNHVGKDFAEAYPCGEGENGFTICDEGSEPIDAEDEPLLLAMRLVSDTALDPGTDTVVLGWAFDSDNDPDDNFEPPAELANDYFGQTDLWYAATYTPDDGWALVVTDLSSGEPQSIATNARVILHEDVAVLVVPLDDFVAPDPGVRVSIFRHPGDGGADGTWSGFVHPALGDDLIQPIPH